MDPWLPASHEQNTVVTRAAAAAAGAFALGGYETVYDGVGAWFLPAFAAATHLEHLDYMILLPPVDICVQRVATRRDHGFTDEPATGKMHAEFAAAQIAERHVLRRPPDDPAQVARLIESARAAVRLTHPVP